ncbi:hypothetical protein [Dysgonomonas sp. 25]|uniref:hypothetical protein n=1 Tax=Dysgonomonas sp. 25 TaxID=2302933 RepID=UPI0013D29025|nr:hypothetical protein [Dysgonomonas sp. 25]NDV68672.1 hypothetical protein [Dysgonomonas sp. 25]
MRTFKSVIQTLLICLPLILVSCSSDDDNNDNSPKGSGGEESTELPAATADDFLPSEMKGRLGDFLGFACNANYTFTYDDQNRLASVKEESISESSDLVYIFSVNYNEAGTVTSISEKMMHGDRTSSRKGYPLHQEGNTIRWDQEIHYNEDGTVETATPMDYTITLNANGWVSKIDVTRAGPVYRSVDYTYDAAGRLLDPLSTFSREGHNDLQTEYDSEGLGIFRNVETPSWVLFLLFEEFMPRAAHLKTMANKGDGVMTAVSFTDPWGRYHRKEYEITYDEYGFPEHIQPISSIPYSGITFKYIRKK